MLKTQSKKLKTTKNNSLLPLRYKAFQKEVMTFYNLQGRKFPWRETRNPYYILVSEFMLQQTQTERVIPKYREFLKKFPTITKLSKASLHEVLILWSGLGYNRRAKFLWQTAQAIVQQHKGVFPDDIETLKTLPGIGDYTAHALRAFIFDSSAVCIETNIRTVYLHHFFKDKTDVGDMEIRELVVKTLPSKNFREWYYGLMDLGVSIKSQRLGIDKKSRLYKKQSAFKGSNREVRGTILKLLIAHQKVSINKIKKLFPEKLDVLSQIISSMQEENLIQKKGLTLLPAPH